METKEILDKLVEKLEKQVGTRLVFGDIIEKKSKIVIPVAKVVSGIGLLKGGFSKFSFLCGKSGNNTNPNELAGGCVRIIPLGVIEVKDDQTRFIPVTDFKRIAGIFVIGALFGILFLRKKTKPVKKVDKTIKK